jgi:hypothetical protein
MTNQKFNPFGFVLILIFCVMQMFACDEASKVTEEDLQPSEMNVESNENPDFCSEHNKECLKFAREFNWTLEEYHEWDKQQQEAIAAEDEMTNENGDIVDPNACTECGGTGKVVVGCDGYPYRGKCDNGYWNCDECRKGNSGWYYDANGEICKKCDGNGRYKCFMCAGLGEKAYVFCKKCRD